MAFTEDLDLFLSHDGFAVPVVIGATTTTGIVDFADQAMLGDDGRGEVVGRIRTVLVKTSAVEASGLVMGGALTVDGIARTARDIGAVDDGAFTLIALRG